MSSATIGERIFKRLSMAGVAVVTAGAIMTVTASTASAAPVQSPTVAQAAAAVAAETGTPVDTAVVQKIVDNINAARGSLSEGQSKFVYDNGEYALSLGKAGGKTTLRAVVSPTSKGGMNQPRGFCHTAAMAAVYGIGAAAFAAAAAVGGIEVIGIAISADAAQALSVALSAGSGVSALVSQYIC
ncbi:hypothetical protein ACFP1Z_25260 [Streptomyces gamaensis]|uniref:Secreted protein n=1 Tax=Streptomyces gamaensis TaxID=1763542 RepID=A0ABW0Z6B2_9ACTN